MSTEGFEWKVEQSILDNHLTVFSLTRRSSAE
jgi:hypothetical protein